MITMEDPKKTFFKNIKFMTSYHFFSEAEFDALSKKGGGCLVSIFIPTEQSGKEILEEKPQLMLKNLLKEVRNELERYYISDVRKVDEKLSSVEDLIEDTAFWRNQSDGLALFIDSDNNLSYFSLPIKFKPYHYISSHFYLKPLLPFFNGDGLFYLLNLSKDKAELYKGRRHKIKKIEKNNHFPKLRNEVLYSGNDNDALNFRSGRGTDKVPIYHSHGSSKDLKDKDLVKFFSIVDESLNETISNPPKAPLVLACTEENFSKFKEVSSYSNIFDNLLKGNHFNEDKNTLQQKSWEVVKDYYQKDRKDRVDTLLEHYNSGKATGDFNDIVKAAIEGRVDTLFIDASAEEYGIYDNKNNTLFIDNEKTTSNVSLINLAATESFKYGAAVYLIHKEEMPLKGSAMNALLRH